MVTANVPTDGPFIVNARGHPLEGIEVDTADAVGNVQLQGGVVDGLIARSSRAGAIVCRHAFGTIRNSACVATGTGSWAAGPGRERVPLADADGSQCDGRRHRQRLAAVPPTASSASPGSSDTVDIVNSITRGTSSDVVAVAVQVNGFCPESVTISLDYSDYAFASATAAVGCTTGAGVGERDRRGHPEQPDDCADARCRRLPPGGVRSRSITAARQASAAPRTSMARRVRSAPPPTSGRTSVRHPSSSARFAATRRRSSLERRRHAPRRSPTRRRLRIATDRKRDLRDRGHRRRELRLGGVCTLAPSTATASSCQLMYTPLDVGTGTHQVTGSYGGGGSHDPSQGTLQRAHRH